MKNMLIDFIPVLLFFVAFKIYGIYVATVVGIVATALQVAFTAVIRGKVDKQQLVTLFVFLVFGSMTLYFHNPVFVKLKPSVIFWIFGVVLLGSQFIGKKPVLQRMMEHVLSAEQPLPAFVWRRMNFLWSVFFIVLGCLNLFIAFHFSTNTWVNFKFYGILGLTFVFSFFQAMYLSRFMNKVSR